MITNYIMIQPPHRLSRSLIIFPFLSTDQSTICTVNCRSTAVQHPPPLTITICNTSKPPTTSVTSQEKKKKIFYELDDA